MSDILPPFKHVTKITWNQEGWWLSVEHDGQLTWDVMQDIKNKYFGEDITCVEIYPPEKDLVNNGNIRHLWRSPNMVDFL